MLNKAIIMGRLVHDPEIKTTQSGLSVCSFRIACDRDIVDKSTNQRETDFINVTAWRTTADFVGKYFSKGSMIIVEGRIQVRSYTDKDSNKRIATEIVANSVYFGDSKKKDNNSAGGPPASTPNETPPAQNNAVAEDDDGDLPF